MRIAVFVFLLALAPSAYADAPAPSQPTLAQLAWMVGTWRGGDHKETIEEQWHAAIGESMIGTFRLVGADGKVAFYELLTVEADGAAPVLRIRHFSRTLVAWEEKDQPLAFALVRVDGQRAVFETKTSVPERLTYTVAGDGLVITLEKTDQGKRKTSEFRFTRSR